jgi:hypothetical protein
MNGTQVDRALRRSMFFWRAGRDYNYRAAERAIHL